MSQFKFIPNAFCRDAFNAAAMEYCGDDITPLIKQAIGKDNFDKHHGFAKDYFRHGETEMDIRIIVNPEETNSKLLAFRSIGTLYKI